MTERPRPPRPEAANARQGDAEQLRQWSNALGVSPAELQRIMTEVGRDLDKVRAYLNTRA